MTDLASDSIRLRRARTHCDGGIRYCIWALNRVGEVDDEVRTLERHLFSLAQIVALLEGALNEREAGIMAREVIIPRYRGLVESEEWAPSWGSEPTN